MSAAIIPRNRRKQSDTTGIKQLYLYLFHLYRRLMWNTGPKHVAVWTKAKMKPRILLEQILLWRQSYLVLLLLHGLCSTQSAGTSGGNETDLATSWCVPPDCWGFANMLMVTTTEGMLNGLFGDRKGTSVWATSGHSLATDPINNIFHVLPIYCF